MKSIDKLTERSKKYADRVHFTIGEKPKTNADHIRAMTDDELADEILRWFNWLNAVEWNDKRILDWLKQEATD